MKILYISPLPPPISGQSKVGQIILESLTNEETYVVDLGKAIEVTTFTNFFRSFVILKALTKVFKYRNESDVIYISLAESFLGIIRDLSIYFLCRKKLDKVVIHMLGGTSMRKILVKDDFFGKLNRYYISKLGAVIVEGSLNYHAFSKVIDANRVHIIPNFAEDFIFTNEEMINKKFDSIKSKINILYLSNLLPGKGYSELLDAFLSLDHKVRSKFSLTFVGGFESNGDEEVFQSKIADQNDINYLGKFIDHEPKIRLYAESHIMCLPTYYIAEGLPIAILEAYAAGIAVITTYHSGIPDVFKDGINGLVVQPSSPDSIKNSLIKISEDPKILENFAINNYNQAMKNHRMNNFTESVKAVFQSII